MKDSSLSPRIDSVIKDVSNSNTLLPPPQLSGKMQNMGIIILKLKSGVEEMVQWIKHSFFLWENEGVRMPRTHGNAC